MTATRFASGTTSFSSSIRLAAIGKKCHAGKILARVGQRHRQPDPYRTVADATYDRYGALACIKQRLDNVTTNSKQKVGLLRNKFLRQLREALRVAVGITVNDLEITIVNKPALRESASFNGEVADALVVKISAV
jgi:hypothetical protein